MREAFENSLRDNPDDLAGWCAYADWLAEQGDPLGEFMQVQLALEDESRAKPERDQLKQREAELLAAHEREWLGELGPHLLDPASEDEAKPVVHYTWRRGFLSTFDTQCLSVSLGQALASSPAAVLLRELRIRRQPESYDVFRGHEAPRVPTPPGESKHYGEFELLGSRCLTSVRVFRTGDDRDEPPEDGWCDSHSWIPGLDYLLTAMPRAEEVHLLSPVRLRKVFESEHLSKLRVFRAYHIGQGGGDYAYPLDVLAANPAFANLTHLQFHPHHAEEGYDGTEESYIPLAQVQALVNSPHLKKLTHLQLRLSDAGDDGVRAIIASGLLKRLKWLDLRHGCVTDEGAALFAACPDAKNLERLDLTRNAVSAQGLAVLRAAGVNAVANNPLTQDELEWREYLREGDFE